jgi:peptidoglycan/LPS O-acetylase OafA/YrhL
MTRLSSLDGLRAVAVIIVMLSHAGLGNVIPGGFGVTMFFFLSGYLITTLMVKEWEKEKRLDLSAFYLRRAVRILPPMFIAILAAVALSGAGLGRDINYEGLIWDFLFLSNYAPIFDAGSNIPIPLWSLAIEEHFYLLFPLLFYLICKRRRPAAVAVICAMLCIVVLLVRINHVASSGPIYEIYYWSHTRIDSILFGCILATWNNPVLKGRTYLGFGNGWAALGVSLILLTLVVRNPEFRETWRYTLQGIGLFLIFNYALRTTSFVAKILSIKILRVVADLSYFLYLIHFPLLLAASYLPIPTILQYVIGIGLSFILAVLVRDLVELPLLQWRKSYHARVDVPLAIRPKGIE